MKKFSKAFISDPIVYKKIRFQFPNLLFNSLFVFPANGIIVRVTFKVFKDSNTDPMIIIHLKRQ